MKFSRYFWNNSKWFLLFMAIVEIFILTGSYFDRYHNNEPLYVNVAIFGILLVIIVGDYTQWRKLKK